MQGGKGGIQPLDLMLFATPEKIFGMIEQIRRIWIVQFYRSCGTHGGYCLPHCVFIFLRPADLLALSTRICVQQSHAEIQHHAAGRVVL